MIKHRVWLLLLLCLLSQPITTANAYQLGRGLQLNNNLLLGGYTGIDYRNIEGENSRFDLREFSVFMRWSNRPRWQIFAELEVENVLSFSSDESTSSHAEFSLERLYIDYQLQPQYKLRIGKYLTPIGRWNQMHAPPLVWTVFRPLVSSIPFSRHSTGLSLHGSIALQDNSLDYILYADNSKLLDPYRKEDTFEEDNTPELLNAFENAIGAYFQYNLWDDNLSIGVSVASFRMLAFDERKDLLGIDWHWLKQGYEFNAETFYRYSEGNTESKAWGVFVQGVIPLFYDFSAIISHETLHNGLTDSQIQISSLGLAYRPLPPLVFKLEYHESDQDNEFLATDGWLASIAVLF